MNKNKKKIISLSFKEDEAWLYEKLTQYSCPSGIIKDVLKKHFGGLNNKNKTDIESDATTNNDTNQSIT